MRNLGHDSQVVTHKTVDNGQEIIRLIAGRVNTETVIEVTREISEDRTLQAWRDQVMEGRMTQARKTATLSLVGSDGVVVAKWSLVNAWPAKLGINPHPVEGTSEIASPKGAVEVLGLVCERIIRLPLP